MTTLETRPLEAVCTEQTSTKPPRHRSLFGKYAITIVSVVILVLLVNGLVEAYIIFRQTTESLAEAQRLGAAGISRDVDVFLADLERQVSWVTRASATRLQDHRSDYTSLLREVSSVAEVSYIDGDWHRRLKVSRRGVDTTDIDLSGDPIASHPHRGSSWLGPVTFESGEPFVMLNIAHAGTKAGVTTMNVSLEHLSSMIAETILPSTNYAYVVDATGKVIGASRRSPIKANGQGRALPTTKSVLVDEGLSTALGDGTLGNSVIWTRAPIEKTDWSVSVEEKTSDAFKPIFDFLVRLAGLTALGLLLATFAGLVLARRMLVPIRALHEGAAHLANNEFDRRIDVRTGDELEELAAQFNRMSGDLADSYGRLEVKVEERTRDLAQSVRELKALEETGRELASSLDQSVVFASIVSRAVELTKANAGAIYTRQPGSGLFELAEGQGFPLSLQTAVSTVSSDIGDTLDAALASGIPITIPDLAAESRFPSRNLIVKAGFQSALVVGLVGPTETRGALVVYWRDVRTSGAETFDVMQTFAHQAVLALHNARLFNELIEKGRQLEFANAHRTQFFANMSHELRTPLNAVLGYTELLHDGLYGELPERAVGVLDRVQVNGKHLLGLINDVLDLTKMEAGALTLSLNDYSMKGLVENVVASTESLAKSKGLAFTADVPDDLPVGRGDDRRLCQVLLNLVGNAIKFTDKGSVRIRTELADAWFHVGVIDTGPGIPPEEQGRIFEEFQQVEDSNLRKGGTGLGLSISNRLLKMHGGHIALKSAPGEGSTFTLVVPVRVAEQRPVE